MQNIKLDHYEVIGVPRNASQQEIAEACMRLGETNHPERDPGDADAARRFKTVEDAYAVLSDPVRRAVYDQELDSVQYTPPIAPKSPSGGRGVWVAAGAVAVVVVALAGWYAVSGDSTSKGQGIFQKIASMAKTKPGKLAIDAHQSLKKLQAATESGINHGDYGRQLAETWFSVKTYLESPDAKTHPEVVGAMNQAIVAYNKAALVWRVQISEPDSRKTFEDRKPSWATNLKEEVPDLDRFLSPAYDLATRGYDPKKRQYDLKEAIQGYWGDASTALKQIESAMR